MSATLNRPLQLVLVTALAALLCGVAFEMADAQAAGVATPPATLAPPPKISLAHLYLQFFLYEAHLEHVALAHPIKSPVGKPIEEHLREKVGLSQNEWQIVSASSLRMETTHRALETQAQPLMAADRQACKSTQAACTAPPDLLQIKALQKQHKDALDNEIRSLESSLGPDSTAKLRNYLKTDLATHIKVTTITPAQMRAAAQARAASR